VADAEGFEHVLEDLFGVWRVEVGQAVVTAEGDEVEVAFVLETLEAWGHGVMVRGDGRERPRFRDTHS
jgi:hypothetical protein